MDQRIRFWMPREGLARQMPAGLKSKQHVQSRFTTIVGTQLQEHTEDQVFLEVTEKKIRLFNIRDRTEKTLVA